MADEPNTSTPYAVELPLSEEAISAIDAIATEGRPTYCMITHPELDLCVEENDPIRLAGFVAYACLPNYMQRRPYERSFWLWRMDGRSVPELHVLATIKYGVMRKGVKPIWIEAKLSNRTLQNVMLESQASAEEDGRVRTKYGVRSNTPEYRKRYYADPVNKQRQRESSKASARKKREEFQHAVTVKIPRHIIEALNKRLLPNDRQHMTDDQIFEKLSDPAVQAEITVLTQMLMRITGISEEEALVQACDKILGFETTTSFTSLEPSTTNTGNDSNMVALDSELDSEPLDPKS